MSQEIGAVSNEAQEMHNTFWQRTLDDIHKLNDFKVHELPLARIKKIMKLDEEVKMISAEAPVLFSKAAEIFISELSLRAWIHTEENKRRTLQRNDIAMAITKYDQFDFLIDIVPREEIKSTNKRSDEVQRTPVMADQVQYFFQLAQQAALQNQNSQATTTSQSAQPVVQQPVQLQLGGTTIPAITIQPQTMGDTSTPTQPAAQPQVLHVQIPQTQGQTIQAVQQQQQQPQQQQPQPQPQHIQVEQPQPAQQQQTQAAATTQVFQQVLTPSGELQNVPIQLTQDQIQAITLQLQGKQPGQPILIQTAPGQGVQEAQAQGDTVTDQSQFSTQPLFQVPLNISGQQVFIQQGGDGLTADQGTIEIQDS